MLAGPLALQHIALTALPAILADVAAQAQRPTGIYHQTAKSYPEPNQARSDVLRGS